MREQQLGFKLWMSTGGVGSKGGSREGGSMEGGVALLQR